MHRAYNLALRFGVDPVREFAQRLIDTSPKGDAIGNRRRRGNRAEAGNDLVADLAIDAAGLDQAALQPDGSLAKASDHGSKDNMIASGSGISSEIDVVSLAVADMMPR
jgi:hypothetical protein